MNKVVEKLSLMASLMLFASLISLPLVAYAQTGVYTGTVTQNEGGISDQYDMVLDIQTKGKTVSGTTSFYLPNQKKLLVRYSFTGTKKGDALELHETETLEAQNINGYFCFKDMTLTVQGDVIKGNWRSENCKNAKGVIKLFKLKEM